MALNDPVTKPQIKYIEDMLDQLGIYEKRHAYYKDIISNTDIASWDRAEASKFIDYCKTLLREKKSADENKQYERENFHQEHGFPPDEEEEDEFWGAD